MEMIFFEVFLFFNSGGIPLATDSQSRVKLISSRDTPKTKPADFYGAPQLLNDRDRSGVWEGVAFWDLVDGQLTSRKKLLTL